MSIAKFGFKDMAVAVTGGAGFIGSHLVERLLAHGCPEIRVIDSLAYGKTSNLSERDHRITLHELYIRSGTKRPLEKIFDGVDVVFHLAAEKHNQSMDSPLKVIDSNIAGTYEVLSAAQKAGVKKIVFSSSLYAYGRLKGEQLIETEIPVPSTVYGTSKLAGENLCRHFNLEYELSTVCLRYFFAYGPRQYTGRGYKSVILKNFERLLQGQPPIINGDGRQSMDYVYVQDIIDLTLAAASLSTPFVTLNVCRGVPVTILELTEMMQRIAQTSFQPILAPADVTNHTHRVGNPELMKKILRRMPEVSLEQGLINTFEWIKQGQV